VTGEVVNERSKIAAEELLASRLNAIVNMLVQAVANAQEGDALKEKLLNDMKMKITDYMMSVKVSKLKPEEIDSWQKQPYAMISQTLLEEHSAYLKQPNTCILVVPRMWDVQLGYMIHQTQGYNYFLVTRYVEWLGAQLPELIKRELHYEDGLPLKVSGQRLIGPNWALDKAQEKYGSFLGKRDEDGIDINRRRAFELIAELLRDGILPFTPAPVDQKYFVHDRKTDFELRDYQKSAWETFKQYGNLGIFWPPSIGKTFISMYVCTHLAPPHLIAVNGLTLVEQWMDRLRSHTDLKVGREAGNEVIVTTYQSAVKKFGDMQFTTKIIDEVQHLPADHYVKLSFIKAQFSLGLTGTPWREDGRWEYIFALTGQPVGLDWQYFRNIGLLKSPVLHVWIVKNEASREDMLDDLLQKEKKTIIFCDSISVGERLAAKLKVPFIHGATKDRLEKIEKSPVSIVSRVGDEGLSIPEIERIIEIRWLFGSRRQEAQRFGRLLHGESAEGEHHIIMTNGEYEADKKRFYGIMDKGFKVQIHMEGVSERRMERLTVRGPKHARPLIGYEKEATRKVGTMFEKAPEIRYDSPLLKTPGVQRILRRLKEAQANFFAFLLAKDGNWFDQQTLCTHLGYTTPDSFRHSVRPNELVQKGWVKRKDEKGSVSYRTELGGVADVGGQTAA